MHRLLLATNLFHMPPNQGAFFKLNFQLIGRLEANMRVDSPENKLPLSKIIDGQPDLHINLLKLFLKVSAFALLTTSCPRCSTHINNNERFV